MSETTIIIPQNRGVVNINVENKGKLKNLEKWTAKKLDCLRVGEKLIKAGLPKRGNAILSCNQNIVFTQCADCGDIELKSASYCRDRLCPLCSWRLSLQRYARMSEIISHIDTTRYSFHFVTLTVENCTPKGLSDTLTRMSDAWADVRRQRWAVKAIDGWARSVEVTYNRQTRQLHPHYHVIVMSEDYKVGWAIVREWLVRCEKHDLRAVAAAQNVAFVSPESSAQQVESLAGAVCETFKYSVKSKDLTDGVPLSVVHDIADGLAGRRLIALGGKIKQLSALLYKDDIDALSDDDEPVKLCRKCGSRHLDEVLVQWSIKSNAYIALTDSGDAVVQRILTRAE